MKRPIWNFQAKNLILSMWIKIKENYSSPISLHTISILFITRKRFQFRCNSESHYISFFSNCMWNSPLVRLCIQISLKSILITCIYLYFWIPACTNDSGSLFPSWYIHISVKCSVRLLIWTYYYRSVL